MATLGFDPVEQDMHGRSASASRVGFARGDQSGFCLLARLLMWLTRNAR